MNAYDFAIQGTTQEILKHHFIKDEKIEASKIFDYVRLSDASDILMATAQDSDDIEEFLKNTDQYHAIKLLIEIAYDTEVMGYWSSPEDNGYLYCLEAVEGLLDDQKQSMNEIPDTVKELFK